VLISSCSKYWGLPGFDDSHAAPAPRSRHRRPLVFDLDSKLCRLYLVSVSTNIKQTSYGLSRFRWHDIIVVVTWHFNLRRSCLQNQKHELFHSQTIGRRENIALYGRYVPVKSQMSKSRRAVGEATRLWARGPCRSRRIGLTFYVKRTFLAIARPNT